MTHRQVMLMALILRLKKIADRIEAKVTDTIHGDAEDGPQTPPQRRVG